MVKKRKLGEGKVVAWVSSKEQGSSRTWKNELGTSVRGSKVTLKHAKAFVADGIKPEWNMLRKGKIHIVKFKIEKSLR